MTNQNITASIDIPKNGQALDDTKDLRLACKRLMFELDVPLHGIVTVLAQELSKTRHTNISRQRVSMALSGARKTPAYKSLLEDIQKILIARQTADSAAA